MVQLDGYEYREARYYGGITLGKKGGNIKLASWQGVTLHSAEILPDPCGYICGDPDRAVSYHFSQCAPNTRFIQNVPLDKRAWHAGSKFNGAFIGICFAGPNDRDRGVFGFQTDTEHFLTLLTDLDNFLGKRLKFCMHRHVDIKKRDPRGFGPDLLTFLKYVGCTEAYYTKAGLIWVR